jgi:hypothetical protein
MTCTGTDIFYTLRGTFFSNIRLRHGVPPFRLHSSMAFPQKQNHRSEGASVGELIVYSIMFLEEGVFHTRPPPYCHLL